MSDTITAAQLIDRTRRWVTGSRGTPLNRLQNAVDDTEVELQLSYDPGPVAANTYIGLDDEMLYVWEVTRGANTLAVSRGQLGTEAAAHAALAVVETSARFPRATIKDTLQDEIRAWPDDVFQVKSKILASAYGQGSFDLGVREGDFLNVFSVERSPSTRFTSWRVADRWTSVPFRVDRKMPRDVFPSGAALTLTRDIPSVGTIRVLYSAPFDVDDISDGDDVVDDWGLARSMCDIVPIGAAARLIQASENRRTDTEALGESRVAGEVPPSYQSQTAAALRRIADSRLRQEAMRLRGRYRFPSG